MGEAVKGSVFLPQDFRDFEKRLWGETELLKSWFDKGVFDDGPPTAGFELEAWLVDQNYIPSPCNDAFINQLASPYVVHELSKFNIEINGDPLPLKGRSLHELGVGMQAIWDEASDVAEDMDIRLMMTGILPTLRDADLVPENMSVARRYEAINREILRARKGRPIDLNIRLREQLTSQHMDVMLEAATTSFQIHRKVTALEAANFYNASKIVSGPILALGANSPYLFGHDLWAETRIPLFEQAVSVGKWDYAERVTFGVRYLEKSMFEVFLANRQRYPVILPQIFDDAPDQMRHVRMHNGTIWRWTRPVLGFNEDGQPHLRIEQRVLPAGPTVMDCMANAAFFYGLAEMVNRRIRAMKRDIPFPEARDNFYAGARHGLDAEMVWSDGKTRSVEDLALNEWLPMAAEGLSALEVDEADAKRFLGIIESRVKSGQNGAVWQRRFMKQRGKTFNDLSRAYYRCQQHGNPVHDWSV
ncbi:MAG: hypothetical protein KAI28_09150 [Sphingomonadales bacterium]|nr:hypothetical protein [Sphingomonadales bacterium]